MTLTGDMSDDMTITKGSESTQGAPQRATGFRFGALPRHLLIRREFQADVHGAFAGQLLGARTVPTGRGKQEGWVVSEPSAAPGKANMRCSWRVRPKCSMPSRRLHRFDGDGGIWWSE